MRLTISAIFLASTIHIASATDNVTVTLPTGIVSGAVFTNIVEVDRCSKSVEFCNRDD